MRIALSDEQRLVVATAKRVASEYLEPRAAHYDETATHPVESWKALWENGLLGMATPRAYGGLGLDMLTYVMVVEALAQGCTNTAMTVHMHSVVQRYIDALAAPEVKAWLYPEVVEEGRMFGSWGSEPGRRGGSGVVQTVLSRDGDGFVINGQKHFCTMAGGAYRYMVHCSMEGMGGPGSVTMAMVPRNAEGLRITGEWNTLGMRATVSPSVAFDGCRVPSRAVMGRPGLSERAGVGQGFGLGYAAVYLGAATRALEFFVEHSKTSRYAPDPEMLSHSLVVQRGVAEMTLALEGARGVLYDSASRWEDDSDPIRRAILAARAKYLATQAALMVTSKTLQLAGGRVAHRRYPLERIYRDVRTCTLMPPNAERSLEIVGRSELGLTDDLLVLRHSS